jgi:hypothetical protein
MAIRLDPRRASALKLLASEAGVRPGELVTRWVEERLDAARAGGMAPIAPAGAAPGAVQELSDRLDALIRRVDELAAAAPPPTTAEHAEPVATSAAIAPTLATAPRPRGRPRTKPIPSPKAAGAKVGLHDEIAAVITERGPQTAAELAAAVVERGRYTPPRSTRPIDAAIVNSRVSNPVYRDRFVRRDGRIGLAEGR